MKQYTSIALLCASYALINSCTPTAPEPVAKEAVSTLPLKPRFQSSPIDTPDISHRLLSLFRSPQLKSLIQTALANNPSLKATESQIKVAELNLKRSKSNLLPTVLVSGDAGRTGSRGNSASRFSVEASASWELDIWKKIDTQIISSKNDLQIQKANHLAAQQSIAAQVMLAWTELIRNNKLLDLSNSRLASFEKTENLVNRKFENGTSNLGALNLAKTDVESTRAEIASRTNSRDQASRSLANLLGNYPDTSIHASQWPSLDKGIRPGAPSSLLRKRPDLQAAYLSIIAADINVTLAHKELYPDFSLTSSLGQQGNVLTELARSSFNSWSLLAQISTPLFDAGKRKVDIAIEQESAKQAIYSYQSLFLNSLQEVENALGSESKLITEEQHTSAALKAATKAEERMKTDSLTS